MPSASSIHEAGHAKPVLWDNPEGRVEWEVGAGVPGGGGHMYGTCIPVANSN